MKKSTYLLTLLLTALFCLPWTSNAWADEITVADGTTTNQYVPFYGYYMDQNGMRSQIIYPASALEDMLGGSISGITFYSTTSGWSNSNATFTVSLAEVDASTLSALDVTTSLTEVKAGYTLSANSSGEVVISFTTPFEYADGKNLLVDLTMTKKGSEQSKYYYGVTASGASYLKYGTSGYTSSPGFRPKATFTYEAAAVGSCAKPTAVTATQNNPVKATLSWTKAEGKDNYQYLYVTKGTDPDWTGITAQNTSSVELDGLTAGTEYDFYVRTYCDAGDGNQSTPVKKTFSTSCPAPTAPQVTNVATTTATLSWTAATGISNYQYIVVNRGGAEDWTSPTLVEGAVTTSLTSLAASTKYDVYVRSYYSANAVSASVKAQFQTPCNAMSYADFNGTFESETAGSGLMPNCWDAAATYNYTDYWSSAVTTYPCVKTSYSTSQGEQCLAFHGGQNSTKNIAVLPVLSEDLSTLTISFKYKNGGTSSYYGQFSVGYYKNGTFTAFTNGTLTRNSSFTLFEMAIPTVPSGARLAIQYAGGTSYNAESFIDEISLYPTPSCTKPSGVTVSNVVYNGATVTWTEDGSATNWKVQYSTDNTNWTTVNVSENPTCTLTGLTTGTPYYVQVISVCGGTDGESPAVAAASTFTPTCVTPGVPSASEKTTNSAKISWAVNSGEAEWNLQYSANGGSSWTTIEDVTENPYTLTGLSSGTTYQVRVAATCNGTYTTAASFDTECEAKNLASYTEGFEGFTTGSYAQTGLTCWGELNAVHSYSYSYPQMYVNTNSSYVKSGNKSLYLVSSSSTYEYAILPIFSGSYAGYQLTFSHKEESASSSGKIALGYLTDASDAGTFQVIKEFTRAESWTTETESINDVPTDARLAFRYGGGSSNYYAGIDDISITALPNCLVPTVVVASNETTNSASISWTNGAEETSWKLQYKAADDENWTAANEGNAFTTKPFALEGLTPNTTYYVQVKAVCGGTDGESDWSASGEFETECNAIELADFATETFATSSVPDCWKVTTVGDNSWATTTSNYQRHSSPYAMQFAAYTEVGNYSDLISPAITLTEDAFLKFYLYNSYSSDPVVGEVYIQYESTTTKIYDFVVTNNVEQQVVDLAAYTGKTAKFIFRGHGNGQSNYRYAAIDDVEIVAKPCDAPTDLSKVESSSSVVLSWTDDAASKWNLRWREVTEPESAWNNVENLTAKNLTLSTTDGLAFEKTYEAQVQAVCTDVKSSDWSDLISFGLVCGAAPTNLTVSARTANSATLTWEGAESAFQLETSMDGDTWESPIAVNAKTYNLTGLSAGTTYFVRVQNHCGGDYATTSFKTWCDLQDAAELPLNIESFTAIPECWEINFVGEYSGITNNKIYFYGEAEQMAVLPAYNIELNKLSVTFGYSTNNANLEFGYLDEPNGTFNAFASQPASGVELNLENEAAAAKYIAVRYTATSAYASGSISSVLLRKTPTCAKPTDLTATPAVGAASIDWTSEATAWNLQYKLASAADWTDAAVTAKPFEITSLAQGASYKVRVQANCGDELSDWSDEISFTTSCSGIDAIPYYADFSAELSSCWGVFAQNESYYKPTVNTAMQQLTMNGGKDGASNNVVVMPPFSADLSNAVINFEYSCSTGANYAQLEVGYVTDKADAATFVALGEPLAQSSSWVEARVATATVPENAYIAFRYAGASSHGDLAIRNLRVSNQLVLANDGDNSDALEANNGQTLDVQINRTFYADGNFNTICLPFGLPTLDGTPLEGGELLAFKYGYVENGELLLRVYPTDAIEAGVPYLISWTAGENIVNPIFTSVTIAASAGKSVGENNDVQFVGIFAPETFQKDDKTKLFMLANNQIAWSGIEETGHSLKSFRAYFQTNTPVSSAPIRHGMPVRIVMGEQIATGCENIQGGQVQSFKVLENNQVVIIRNGVKYNLQGQKIQ